MTHRYTTLRGSRVLIQRVKLFITSLILITGFQLNSQVTAYSFTPVSGTYTALVGGTAVTAIQTDDAISGLIPLPFTFTYNGVGYTSVKASSNGWITFNSTATLNLLTNDMDLGDASCRPLLAPLWDDIDGTTLYGGAASYLTSGVSPNRVFTFEWKNWQWNYTATVAVISFQVKLYETTNVIEFIYQQEAGAVINGSSGANIGITAATTGSGTFISLLDASAAPGISTVSDATTIGTKPATGQIYRFTPPIPCTGTPEAGSVPLLSSACTGVAGANTISVTGYTTGVTGISFQWEESNDDGVGDAWVNAVGGTGSTTASYTLPALFTPIYYRCRVSCDPSGGVDYTNSTYVTLSSCTYDIIYSGGASWSSIIPSNGGSGTAYPSWAGGLSGDDETTNPVSLAGTTFQFEGNTVTQFVACTNGWMSFTNTTSTSFSNGLTSTSQTKVLAPFWDDLVLTGTNHANADNCMRYQINGTLGSGTAVITIEWANMERYTISGPNLNFQVKLYEAGNVIEFIYGNFEGYDGTVTSTYTYSVGYNGVNPAGATALDRFCMQAPAVTNYFSAASDPASHSYLPDCYSKFTLFPGTYTGPIVAPTIPAPSNDNAGTALILAVNGTPCSTPNLCDTYANSRSATNSGIGTAPCSTAGYEDDDVFFQFNTEASSDYIITLRSSPGYDAVVQLFNAAMVPISCVNATGAGAIETLNATGLTPGGTTYYIRVFHNAIGSGTSGQFSICLYQATPPPANDECSGAYTLAVGTSCSYTVGTTTAATSSIGEVAACAGNADDDVWFSFVATDANPVISVQSGGGFNAVFSVYSGTCGALTSLNCINATATAGFETTNMSGLTIGNTYYIRVHHFAASAGSGNFLICVYNPVPGCTTYISPANGATGIVTTGVNLTWNTATYASSYDVYFSDTPTPTFFGNTTGTSMPTGVMLSGTTYYWRIIPKNVAGEAAGCTIYSFTTVPVCSGTPFAAGATSTSTNVCSALTSFTLNAPGTSTDDGVTYQWQHDNGGGYTDIAGATTLSYSTTQSEQNSYRVKVVCTYSGGSDTSAAVTVTFLTTPTGDVMGDPISIFSLPTTVSGDNLSANCWTSNMGGVSPDVFYKVVPDCNGTLTATTCASLGTLNDTWLYILDGAGTILASVDDFCGLKSTVTASVTGGSTYFVVIEGFSTGEGTYTIDISSPPYYIIYYADADGDTYGNLASTLYSCSVTPPVGYVTNSTDCNDANAAVHPGATEVCNGIDDDCDALSDDADPGITGQPTWYLDGDGDGYGDITMTAVACNAPSGYVADNTDCNDGDAGINPGASEICNAIDEDCDGTPDDGLVFTTWYADSDGDLYGDDAVTASTCDGAPVGYIADNTDCNDADAAINPGASEVCNGTDDDCNGTTDDGLPLFTYYLDGDGDGYGGIGATSIDVCDEVAPSGYSVYDTDCDDGHVAVNPGATEICNDIDDNCDGFTDDGLITAVITPGGPTSFCQGESVTLFANIGDGYTYQWKSGAMYIPGATNSSFTVSKTASITVIVTIPGTCSDESDPVATTRLARPIANVINGDATNDLCFDASIKLKANLITGVTYQWYKGGTLLAGQTNYLYFATTIGNYKIFLTSTVTGCTAMSLPYSIIKTCKENGLDDDVSENEIHVYPNPADNEFTVDVAIATESKEATIELINILGEVVYTSNAVIDNGIILKNIKLDDSVAGGIYIVKVTAGSTELTNQVVIQK